jgi:hypothetical protein
MYGILSLIGKKYGKDAMRRVLAIAKQYPEDRHVRTLKNQTMYEAWYPYGVAHSSRMGAAEGLLRNASKYVTPENKATPYSGIMQKMKSKINSERTTKDLINWYRANPDEYAKMNEAGRTYWGEFGGEEYVDDLASNAISQMAKRNMQMRGLTDYEKYMVALARQRRQDAILKQNYPAVLEPEHFKHFRKMMKEKRRQEGLEKGADVIPFPGGRR